MSDFSWNETPILSIKNLNKRFGPGCSACLVPNPASLVIDKNICTMCGTVHALRQVNFEVFPGEIVGIVGESGSGKSTLLKCLYFDQNVDQGEFRLSSIEGGQANLFGLSSQAKRQIRNTKLGMVYQNPLLGLRMDFSAMSNIAEKMIAAGVMRVASITQRANSLLEYVHIAERRRKESPKNFSGGMQQRVQIAKAMSNNPPILLLDEVSTGLDLSVQAKVLDLIKTIQRESQVSMIVVSHDLGVIRMLADRTMVMLNGEVVESGLTDQILEDPQHYYTQTLVHSLL